MGISVAYLPAQSYDRCLRLRKLATTMICPKESTFSHVQNYALLGMLSPEMKCHSAPATSFWALRSVVPSYCC